MVLLTPILEALLCRVIHVLYLQADLNLGPKLRSHSLNRSPKLCLGTHIPEAPLRTRAGQLPLANRLPAAVLNPIVACWGDVLRTSAKRSFGDRHYHAGAW